MRLHTSALVNWMVFATQETAHSKSKALDVVISSLLQEKELLQLQTRVIAETQERKKKPQNVAPKITVDF